MNSMNIPEPAAVHSAACRENPLPQLLEEVFPALLREVMARDVKTRPCGATGDFPVVDLSVDLHAGEAVRGVGFEVRKGEIHLPGSADFDHRGLNGSFSRLPSGRRESPVEGIRKNVPPPPSKTNSPRRPPRLRVSRSLL